MNGADDGVRTRDLNLGKVPRYQLRYVRKLAEENLSQGLSSKQKIEVRARKSPTLRVKR